MTCGPRVDEPAVFAAVGLAVCLAGSVQGLSGFGSGLVMVSTIP